MDGNGVKGVWSGRQRVIEPLMVGKKSRQQGELGIRVRRCERQVLGFFKQKADSPSAFQIFDPVSASDAGDYTCEAQNGYGSPMRSDTLHMEAGE